MIVGHLDCSSGVSGDMLLGAVVSAGATLTQLQDAIDAIGVEDIRLEAEQVSRAGLAATSVRVVTAATDEPRRWSDIRSLLTTSALPEDLRERVLAVFARLAQAEAEVHGVHPDEVHFHEVGALDALADVIGVCAGLRALGVDDLTCGAIATGHGTVDTQHGRVPIPAPAVTSLLQGFTLYGVDIARELVTPTGAALVAVLARPVSALPRMALTGVGVGAGTMDLADPNVVRLILGRADAAVAGHTPAVVVEATIDDLSPEFVPLVLDRLRDAGAHDAWATPVLMKKGRPGVTISALANADIVHALEAVLFHESTTLGVRSYGVSKRALLRHVVEVDVDGARVLVKVGVLDGEAVTVAPEFEAVRAAADALGRPARDVAADATAAARALLAATPRREAG